MTETFHITRRNILAGAAFAGAIAPVIMPSTASAAEEKKAAAKPLTNAEIGVLPRVKVDLVKPPFVHAHTQKAEGGPKIVEFTLTIKEQKMILDDKGTEVHAMTFNGSVPGPLMVVHQDDYVELTLINPDTCLLYTSPSPRDS